MHMHRVITAHAEIPPTLFRNVVRLYGKWPEFIRTTLRNSAQIANRDDVLRFMATNRAYAVELVNKLSNGAPWDFLATSRHNVAGLGAADIAAAIYNKQDANRPAAYIALGSVCVEHCANATREVFNHG